MKAIYKVLKENGAIGAENAMTKWEIMNALDIHNARRITGAVNTERKASAPASTAAGKN